MRQLSYLKTDFLNSQYFKNYEQICSIIKKHIFLIEFLNYLYFNLPYQKTSDIIPPIQLIRLYWYISKTKQYKCVRIIFSQNLAFNNLDFYNFEFVTGDYETPIIDYYNDKIPNLGSHKFLKTDYNLNYKFNFNAINEFTMINENISGVLEDTNKSFLIYNLIPMNLNVNNYNTLVEVKFNEEFTNDEKKIFCEEILKLANQTIELINI